MDFPREATALPLYALYVANAVSRIGDTLMLLALPWFVLQTTGSVALTGLAAAAATAGVALAGISGAVLVDAWGQKRVSVLSDLLSGLVVLAVPVLYRAHALPFGGLMALVFLAGLSTTPGNTARTALVPQLADRAHANLDRVNTVVDGVNRIGTLVGAPLAGLLIAVMGALNLFVLDGISFLASAGLLLLLIPRVAVSERLTPTALRETTAHLREGVRFIRHHPMLRSLMLVVMVTNLLDGGLYSVLAPAFIRSTYHSAVLFGEVGGALGLGAVVGTVLYGWFGYRLPRRATFVGGYLAAGAPRFWVLALVPWAAPLLLLTGLLSIGIGPLNPAIHTAMYQAVPSRLQPRVFGALTTGVTLGTPVGAVLAGSLAALARPWGAILIFSVLYLAATLALAVNPSLKAMTASGPPATAAL
jgi:MFS family permease